MKHYERRWLAARKRADLRALGARGVGAETVLDYVVKTEQLTPAMHHLRLEGFDFARMIVPSGVHVLCTKAPVNVAPSQTDNRLHPE